MLRRVRFGTVTLFGRSNVGKSTFLNAVLGQDLAIVSPLPQTTRDPLLGVVHGDGYQLAFIDTPGLHQPKSELGRRMNAQAVEAMRSAEVVVFMTDIAHLAEDQPGHGPRWHAATKRRAGAQIADAPASHPRPQQDRHPTRQVPAACRSSRSYSQLRDVRGAGAGIGQAGRGHRPTSRRNRQARTRGTRRATPTMRSRIARRAISSPSSCVNGSCIPSAKSFLMRSPSASIGSTSAKPTRLSTQLFTSKNLDKNAILLGKGG